MNYILNIILFFVFLNLVKCFQIKNYISVKKKIIYNNLINKNTINHFNYIKHTKLYS